MYIVDRKYVPGHIIVTLVGKTNFTLFTWYTVTLVQDRSESKGNNRLMILD